jgi:peptidoglycan/LPS O-acetylase OafA/YrhL
MHWVSTPSTLGLDAGAWRVRLGNYGVSIFFLLSGLVLYRPFVGAALDRTQPPAVRSFLRRRFVRIFPAYVVALTVFFGLGLAVPLNITAREYAFQYLLLQNYIARGFAISMGVSWTLCVELAFYVALPILAVGLRCLPGGRARRVGDRYVAQLAGLALLLVVGWGYRIFVLEARPALPGSAVNYLPAFLDWFALGMLLAVLHEGRERGFALPRWFQALANSTLACWLLAAQLYWVSIQLDITGDFFASPGKTLARFGLNGASAFLLLLPAVLGRRPGRALRALDTRPLVFLGTISYGIYLWHPIVLRVAARADVQFTSGSLLLFTLGTTIPIAYASYRIVESPAMRAERRYERRHPSRRRVTIATA